MATSRGGRDSRSAAKQRGGKQHARHEFGSRKGYTEAMLCACGRCGLDCKPAGEGVTLPSDEAERRRAGASRGVALVVAAAGAWGVGGRRRVLAGG